MKENVLKKVSATQKLKERMRGLRKEWKALKLSYEYWGSQVLEQFPEHQNTLHLYNVWYGRVADVEILEYTDQLLTQIKESYGTQSIS